MVATKENHTSSSSVPPQVFGGVEAVAPIIVPPTNWVQTVFGLTGTFMALMHSSLVINVAKITGFDHMAVAPR